ncbi:MAG: anti-sigma-I factor RsgI family protein [Clostridium sp.]
MIDSSEKAIIARQHEIREFSESLYKYGILLKDLPLIKLKKKDRDRALNAAYFIIQDINAYDALENKKTIPVGLVSRGIKVNSSFIEDFKEYIIAYVLILSNPSMKHLQDMLLIREKQGDTNKEVVELLEVSINTKKTGVIVHKGKKLSIILTPQGEFVKIKSDIYEFGGVGTGEENQGLRKYKIHISAAIGAIIIIAGLLFINYNRENLTITVNTTSSIVYEVNGNNKIISAKSQPSKGKTLIENISPLDKGVDKVIKETIKYANENNMIPKDGIVINVSGDSLKYGLLNDVKEYISENNITVLINNNGNERKL